MGAHTLGKFHQRETGHKYLWTTDFQAFSNQYYRNIVGKDDWFFEDTNRCTKVGDAWRNKGKALWVAKMNQVYKSGGPVQWIQKKVVCPDCTMRRWERSGPNWQWGNETCCDDVPDGAFCKPDSGGPNPEASIAFMERDDDPNSGCEESRFIPGVDEAALNSDMGLMYKFEVDKWGFPLNQGCTGLDTFYRGAPPSQRFSDRTCIITDTTDPNLRTSVTAEACRVTCPDNDYVYPGDTETLSDHFRHFADNQLEWAEEFIPVMEKMISNGYEESELITSWPLR